MLLRTGADSERVTQATMLLDLRVDELKALLRAFGLPLTGNKQPLIARLTSHISDPYFGSRLAEAIRTAWRARADRTGLVSRLMYGLGCIGVRVLVQS